MKSLFFKLTALALCTVLCVLCAGCVIQTPEERKGGLVENPNLSVSYYRLGDSMGDYTITDVNGVEHSFSQILETKKAIVLNFWFINCGPCKIEFPYMNEAYQSFKDDIEILAINTVDENEAEIKAFAEENGLSFPVASGDMGWNQALAIQGFPTTVVIDRTGVVSMMHVGYIDSTDTFENIFEFFTDDAYTPTLVEDISDIN